MRVMKSLLLGLNICLFLSLSNSVLAQPTEVTASVDKNPVLADESFNLTVVANDDVDRSAFDPSPLMKDFVVGRTSVSSQTQMINFNTTRTTIWTTVLIPRQKGRFTIPAFSVDSQLTQPIEMMVLPVSASNNAGQSRDIYITTELDVKEAYLQEQLRYTVKLYLGKDLQRGSLASPTLENADIRQIGKDKEYNDIVDGRRYRIIERTFAIIPQQSGTFTIQGPLFEGEVVDNSRQSFGFFNRSTPVNRVGPSQEITILPIPSNYPEHWLPSDFVQLNDEWQGDVNQYHAGEPITRTLTLSAVGVVEEQLPTIDSQYPDKVKTYPDQAENATVEKDNMLIAQRKESIAIIPSEAGELVIPEVRIPWFNILTKKTEYAVVPKKTLTILPAINQPAAPIMDNKPQEINNLGSLPSKPADNGQAKPLEIQPSELFWPIVCAILLLMWLLTVLALIVVWRRSGKHLPQSTASTQTVLVSSNESMKQLDLALKKSDISKIQLYLTQVLSAWTGQPKLNLGQLLKLLQDDALNQEINTMLASQYGSQSQQWNGQKLNSILDKYRAEGSGRKYSSQQLKPLYPESN